MRRRFKFLLAPAVLLALTAGLLTASPAQAAASCYKYDALYLSTQTTKNGLNVNQLHMYAAIPCGWAGYGDETPRSAKKLFQHYLKVSKLVRASDKAYTAGSAVTYLNDQQAAKKAILKDITTYGLPTTRVNGKTVNKGSLADLNANLQELAKSRLTVTRLSHVYQVLFYVDAYYQHTGKLAALPGQIADIWDTVDDVYGKYEKLKKIKSVVDIKKLGAGYVIDKGLTKAGIEIPNLYTVYKDTLRFGSKVAKQLSYNVIAQTFELRIGWAIADSNWVAPTPPSPVPTNWGLTTNTFGPIAPMMTPEQITAVTRVDYSGYLKRFAADRTTAKYCSEAYTELFPGDPRVMVLFKYSNAAVNFGKLSSSYDYSQQAVQAITLLASGNAAADAKLPATDRGIRIGSSLEDLRQAYENPDGSGFKVEETGVVGVNRDRAFQWYGDSRVMFPMNSGNNITFRLHDNRVVAIQVSAHLQSYEDTFYACAISGKPTLK